MSVQDLVKTMQRTLMGSVEDRLILEVRRKFIMKDALKEARKEKFNVKKFVKVKRKYLPSKGGGGGELDVILLPNHTNLRLYRAKGV